MIRCRTWTDRSNRYICALCHHRPARPTVSFARTYSDVPRCPPKTLGGGSGWSSVSIKPAVRRDQIPTGAAPQTTDEDDGLLPHERAAKQTLARSTPPPPRSPPTHQLRPEGPPFTRQKPDSPFSQAAPHKHRARPDGRSANDAPHSPGKRHPAGFVSGSHPHGRHQHKESQAANDSAGADHHTKSSTGWSQLRRRPAKDQDNGQKIGGGNDFWERFKSQVSQDQARSRRTAPVSTGATADTRVTLEEETGVPARPPLQSELPSTEDPDKIAREQRSRARRAEAFEDEASSSGSINRNYGKSARAPDTRRSKRGSSARNRRSSSRYDEDDEDLSEEALERLEERRLRKAERKAQRQLDAMETDNQGPLKILLPEFINLFHLASGLKQKPEVLQAALVEMGFENITEDSIFTGETASLIALEYGFDAAVDTGGERDVRARPPPENGADLPSRPPVVTIMGHVDHGKTTLLDFLRKSSVAAHEHGGITQHIGAFMVEMSSGKRITFLDTPGHAAFLNMRQRGANVTDIVVLVVAADDSVMPQTLEAIKHARAAKVPMIVAINKVDKEDARPDQVKTDLARYGVEIEDFGGDVQVVLVSGKTGQGMDDLEENISLLSEILDVRAEQDGMAEGWVLEASVKQVGKSATVLVKRGTLRLGDYVVAGKAWARVRMLRNEAGVEIAEAPPGTPAEILGWRDELPAAGDQVIQAPDEDRARTAMEYREEMRYRQDSSKQLLEQEQRERDRLEAERLAELAEDGDGEAEETTTAGTIDVNFTVKCDVAGSVEAVCASIQELGNHEVRPRILRSSAGQISEFDIDHAATSNSTIVNFTSQIPAHIKRLAEEQGVRIMDHNIIYHLTDEVKDALSQKLDDTVSYKVVGEAEILQIFPINIKGRSYRNIAGCRVRNGLVSRNAIARIIRKGNKVFEGKIDALKSGKKEVSEMRKGGECGISFDGFEDMEVGDQLQLVEEVREKRTL